LQSDLLQRDKMFLYLKIG